MKHLGGEHPTQAFSHNYLTRGTKNVFMKTKVHLTVLTAAMFLFTGNASGASWPSEVTVVSPAPGTSVHSLLTLMGNLIVEHTPIERWDVQPLGGPELWLPMMKEGKCHFANHSVPGMILAYQGRWVYEKIRATYVRTVAAGHSEMFMFWTTADKQIGSISDLKGKRIFVKYKTNPLFLEMAKNQLASAGLNLSDLKSVLPFSNLSVATKALLDGIADAFLFPVVREAVEEINTLKGECQFIPLTLGQSRYVVERMGGFYVENIRSHDPRFGNLKPVPNAICYQNAMFCSHTLDPDLVHGVAKTIFDHSAELRDAQPLASFWSLNYRPVALGVPYHEGAIRYFREKGLWTSKAQMYQERIISKQSAN
ncbi:MAG: TAXI family TRAP transporter solute-binding subunit [Deltaproteobacteria bacterium]|nr:TAXI family TRAP transporter solute-binding subunit [Deltaproteobacteria bacterium]